MQLFDTHCHLDDEQFDADRDGVVARARQAGVARIITVGVTAQSSRQCLELAGRYDLVSAAVGIQPNHAAGVSAGGLGPDRRNGPRSARNGARRNRTWTGIGTTRPGQCSRISSTVTSGWPNCTLCRSSSTCAIAMPKRWRCCRRPAFGLRCAV